MTVRLLADATVAWMVDMLVDLMAVRWEVLKVAMMVDQWAVPMVDSKVEKMVVLSAEKSADT